MEGGLGCRHICGFARAAPASTHLLPVQQHRPPEARTVGRGDRVKRGPGGEVVEYLGTAAAAAVAAAIAAIAATPVPGGYHPGCQRKNQMQLVRGCVVSQDGAEILGQRPQARHNQRLQAGRKKRVHRPPPPIDEQRPDEGFKKVPHRRAGPLPHRIRSALAYVEVPAQAQVRHVRQACRTTDNSIVEAAELTLGVVG